MTREKKNLTKPAFLFFRKEKERQRELVLKRLSSLIWFCLKRKPAVAKEVDVLLKKTLSCCSVKSK